MEIQTRPLRCGVTGGRSRRSVPAIERTPRLGTQAPAGSRPPKQLAFARSGRVALPGRKHQVPGRAVPQGGAPKTSQRARCDRRRRGPSSTAGLLRCLRGLLLGTARPGTDAVGTPTSGPVSTPCFRRPGASWGLASHLREVGFELPEQIGLRPSSVTPHICGVWSWFVATTQSLSPPIAVAVCAAAILRFAVVLLLRRHRVPSASPHSLTACRGFKPLRSSGACGRAAAQTTRPFFESQRIMNAAPGRGQPAAAD